MEALPACSGRNQSEFTFDVSMAGHRCEDILDALRSHERMGKILSSNYPIVTSASQSETSRRPLPSTHIRPRAILTPMRTRDTFPQPFHRC